MTKRNVSNARAWILSLNHYVLPVWKGHAGFAFTNVKGRCAQDGTEGDRLMQGMRVDRPTERKRYETAVLVLWRQVLVYRPIQTRRLTSCRSYAPFLTRGAHPVKSNELFVAFQIDIWSRFIQTKFYEILSCLLWSTNYITFYQTTVNKKSLYYWSEKYIERKKNCNYYNFIVIYKLFQSIIYIFFVKL